MTSKHLTERKTNFKTDHKYIVADRYGLWSSTDLIEVAQAERCRENKHNLIT